MIIPLLLLVQLLLLLPLLWLHVAATADVSTLLLLLL